MKPVDSVEFQNFISCHQDEDVCYLLSRWKNDTVLTALDPKSLKTNSRTTLRFPVNPFIDPVIDDNYIYFFTQLDGLFVIDKFSLDQYAAFSVDSAIPISNVEQDEECLYVICGTPFMTGVKTNTDMASIVAFDKKTGKRRNQSPIFYKGNFSQLTISNGFLWCVVDKKLLKLDKTGEMLNSVDLQFSTRNKPIVSENLVMVFSKSGSIESFDKSTLIGYRKKIFNQCDFCPFLHLNKIVWGPSIIDVNDFSSLSLNHSIRYLSPDGQFAYGSDTLNNILRISQGIDDRLEVDKELSRPMVFDDHLLVYSANSSQIFRILK